MKTKNILVFFAFLIPAFILALAIRGHYARKTYFRAGDMMMANWSAQRFEPIHDNAHFRQVIDTIPIRNKHILDAKATKSLRQAVYYFFMAYHNGDFDAYTNFRMPTGKGHYDPKLLKWRLHDIAADGAVPETTNLQDGDEIFRDYWIKVGAKTYKDFFRGVCLGESHVTVSSTNSSYTIEHFFDIADFEKTARRLLLNALRSPTFISDPEPGRVLQQYGTLYTATFKCLVKNSDGDAYPVFCFWYYSPSDDKWIPYAIGDDYRGSQEQKTHLVF